MQSLHRVEKSPPSDGTGSITREISRLRVSSERFLSAPYRHASPLEMTMLASAPPVISTEAKRSGEISPSDGTGGITAGDLSAQSIIGLIPVCLPYRHVPPLEMTMLASAPPVISTEAGQPPIGKPLIVQARGQLRLTWRLYAESPQSGEISFL